MNQIFPICTFYLRINPNTISSTKEVIYLRWYMKQVESKPWQRDTRVTPERQPELTAVPGSRTGITMDSSSRALQ